MSTDNRNPFDLILNLLHINVTVRCKVNNQTRRLKGVLHAFDNHLNVILSDVTETIFNDNDDLPSQENHYEVLYVHGKSITSLS